MLKIDIWCFFKAKLFNFQPCFLRFDTKEKMCLLPLIWIAILFLFKIPFLKYTFYFTECLYKAVMNEWEWVSESFFYLFKKCKNKLYHFNPITTHQQKSNMYHVLYDMFEGIRIHGSTTFPIKTEIQLLYIHRSWVWIRMNVIEVLLMKNWIRMK